MTTIYLKIDSILKLKAKDKPGKEYIIEEVNDFRLNKSLYKEVGETYKWNDKSPWTDAEWISYSSSISTFVLKYNTDIIGYFELDKNNTEIEIVIFGLVKEYIGEKLGGYMLSEAIKKSFKLKAKTVWLHTCNLDHTNALNNYLARGMTIYKTIEESK